MKNNLLFTLAKSLTRKEITRFADFAASPYHNKHKDVRALAAFMSEIYPDLSEKRCERTVIFQKLFPGQPHDQPKLAIVFSYTVRLMEQFLVAETLVESGHTNDKALYFSQLRKRNLNNLLKVDWEDAQETATKRTTSQPASLEFTPGFFEKKIRRVAEQDAITMRLGHADNKYMEEKLRLLDTYYLTERLRDACELLERSRLLKIVPVEEPFFENLFQTLAASLDSFGAFPSVNVYFHLYNLLKSNDSRNYSTCLHIVGQQELHFSREELQNIYNYLQNFCIQQINQGHQHFLKEIFQLYQHQLAGNLLLVDGVLPEWHYKNIVTTGLRLEEREWVRHFIEEYSKLLAPEVASNAYSYNLANWHYHVGQPKQVLPLLLQVEYSDLRYNLDAKSLLLRTYFDLEEEEALVAHVEAFGQFLKRNNSLPDFQKKGYFNLIKFAKKAFRLKMQAGFVKQEKWLEDLQLLQSDLGKEETVFNKSWLEAKLKLVAGE